MKFQKVLALNGVVYHSRLTGAKGKESGETQ